MAEGAPAAEPVFRERLTHFVVRDAWLLGAVPLALAGLAGAVGLPVLGGLLLAGTVLVAFFFRNPLREIPDEADAVLAPADGRVIEAGEIERSGGRKALRVAIFLSLLDVHVNRSPVAGRVLSVERRAGRHRAAFGRRAESENARSTLTLELADGRRVEVVQITGWLARRIVCHPEPGEWLERGVRYGLIRFGSRTDVLLPEGSELQVARGQRVRAGETVVARLEPGP